MKNGHGMKPGGKYERMKHTGKQPVRFQKKASFCTEEGASNKQLKAATARAQSMAANLDSGIFGGRGG